MCKVGVAIAAIGFNHTAVVVIDHDGFMEVARRESQRMKETISPFAEPFANEVVWCMTVIALGYFVVSRFVPRVIVVVHDVAVGTCLTCRRQIRRSLCVVKGEGSSSKRGADHDGRK